MELSFPNEKSLGLRTPPGRSWPAPPGVPPSRGATSGPEVEGGAKNQGIYGGFYGGLMGFYSIL